MGKSWHPTKLIGMTLVKGAQRTVIPDVVARNMPDHLGWATINNTGWRRALGWRDQIRLRDLLNSRDMESGTNLG